MSISKHSLVGIFFSLIATSVWLWCIVHVIPYELRDVEQRDNLWLANCSWSLSIVSLFWSIKCLFLPTKLSWMRNIKWKMQAECNHILMIYQNDDAKIVCIASDLISSAQCSGCMLVHFAIYAYVNGKWPHFKPYAVRAWRRAIEKPFQDRSGCTSQASSQNNKIKT